DAPSRPVPAARRDDSAPRPGSGPPPSGATRRSPPPHRPTPRRAPSASWSPRHPIAMPGRRPAPAEPPSSSPTPYTEERPVHRARPGGTGVSRLGRPRHPRGADQLRRPEGRLPGRQLGVPQLIRPAPPLTREDGDHLPGLLQTEVTASGRANRRVRPLTPEPRALVPHDLEGHPGGSPEHHEVPVHGGHAHQPIQASAQSELLQPVPAGHTQLTAGRRVRGLTGMDGETPMPPPSPRQRHLDPPIRIPVPEHLQPMPTQRGGDRKSTRLNSSHVKT